jgi:hypothetical protein
MANATRDRQFWVNRLYLTLLLSVVTAVVGVMLVVVIDIPDQYRGGFIPGMQWAVIGIIAASPLLKPSSIIHKRLFRPVPWDARAALGPNVEAVAVLGPKAVRMARLASRLKWAAVILMVPASGFEAWLAIKKDPTLALAGIFIGFGTMAAGGLIELLLMVVISRVRRWALGRALTGYPGNA